MNNEKVLTVPIDILFKNNYFEGFKHVDDFDYSSIIGNHHSFRPRSYTETDPFYKQIIPYIVIINDNEEIFCTKRTKKQSESRLHDMYSLGIGGHLNIHDFEKDYDFYDGFIKGMTREIDEEIILPQKFYWKHCSGFINDDSNDVGRVHFGMVYIVKVLDNIEVREKDNMEKYSFRNKENIIQEYNNFENWSKIVIDNLLTKI